MGSSSLNQWQQQAVETIDGTLLILAGAGSGKTTVLTRRIVHLVDMGVDPSSILGLTFTNKAAAEMASRLSNLIGSSIAKKIMLSTFHSFALFVLRKEHAAIGLPAQFTIADPQEVQRFLHSIVRDLFDREQGDMPSLHCLLEDISTAKNKCISISDVARKRSQGPYVDLAATVFDRLSDCFRIYGVVDFDHMLWLVHDLFQRNPAVLQKYTDRFRYVMVDEYQDTNPVQASIAMKVASGSGNLCVVGDDDQSIYGWRGADITNILQFQAKTVIKLEQNFRSTSTILKAANSVIKMNQARYDKSLWSVKEGGAPIHLFVAPSEEAEAAAVVGRIVALKERFGFRWSDFCILYRSNALSKHIEQELLRARYIEHGRVQRSVPYKVYGGQELFDHKEVQDILAYLRVLVNRQDGLAIARSINYPRRGIGEASFELIKSFSAEKGVSLFDGMKMMLSDVVSGQIPEKARNGIRAYIDLIEESDRKVEGCSSIEEVVRHMADAIELKQMLIKEIKSKPLLSWKLENIESFFESANSFNLNYGDNCSKVLESFVSACCMQSEASAFSKKIASAQRPDEHVSLMTFHSAKGLEFPICFLIGVEDHLIPHEKSLLESGVEEERRLMYVALTRAKERLFVGMAMQRKRMGQSEASRPSRFLFDIPKECLQKVAWDNYCL